MPQMNMVFITGHVKRFHRKRPAVTPFAQFLTHLLLQWIRCYPSAAIEVLWETPGHTDAASCMKRSVRS